MHTGHWTEQLTLSNGCTLLLNSSQLWTISDSDKTKLELRTLQVYFALWVRFGESEEIEPSQLYARALTSALKILHPDLTLTSLNMDSWCHECTLPFPMSMMIS
jgi:hypothetical protein